MRFESVELAIRVVLTLSLLSTATLSDVNASAQDIPRRNVIMMISDGFGPASETYSRTYYQYINALPFDHMMPLDTIHVGQSRTRSASSLVTDSAAGATAFSCAMKTYNGAIAGTL